MSWMKFTVLDEAWSRKAVVVACTSSVSCTGCALEWHGTSIHPAIDPAANESSPGCDLESSSWNYSTASWISIDTLIVSGFLSIVFQCSSLEPYPPAVPVWLLACSHRRNGFGSIQKGLTFVRRMCWLSWHFGVLSYEILTMPYCWKSTEERRRQSGSGFQFQAACVLDDCGHCCCLFRCCVKGQPLRLAFGQIWKDPSAALSVIIVGLPAVVEPVVMVMWCYVSEESEGWKLQVPWLVWWCRVSFFRFP